MGSLASKQKNKEAIAKSIDSGLKEVKEIISGKKKGKKFEQILK